MIGGNCSMPRALFLDAGGCDPSFVKYGGVDYELSYRLQKVGAYFRFLPDAEGFHYVHENKPIMAYLGNGRSAGRNAVYIVGKHPAIIDRLRIGLVLQPQTLLGRVARTLAFDYPQLGDVLTNGLQWAGSVLEWLRLRHAWNRLMDCLYQYWYFRGVRDALGSYRAIVTYLTKLKAAASSTHE
jgi:hypothetical protein